MSRPLAKVGHSIPDNDNLSLICETGDAADIEISLNSIRDGEAKPKAVKQNPRIDFLGIGAQFKS